MISEIYFEQSMAGSFESDLIELIRNDINEEKIRQSATSLAIYWTDVAGTLDSEVQIFSSLDGANWSLADNFIINTENNIADIMIYLIDTYIKYLKIKFIKNGTTDGKFTASLSFSGV